MPVALVGIVVLVTREKDRDSSWLRVVSLGSMASVHKRLSGGGYGPAVTAGQILTGVEVRAAVGIISSSEGVACIAALPTYHFSSEGINCPLALVLAIGVALSTPVAVFIVKKIGKQVSRVDYRRIYFSARNVSDFQNRKGL